jgi:photosynthetic reaction center cytochrome c subunit
MTARRHLPRLLVAATVVLVGCERPPPETLQTDFRGLGSVHIANPRILEARLLASVPPETTPVPPPSGTPASAVYRNVQVLGDLDVAEFTHLMAAITQWVSPEQGCVYCHSATDFAEDTPYTKIVARQMLQMTRNINQAWPTHVGETGVTCWTCHRGEPVPAETWTQSVPRGGGLVGGSGEQNIAASSVNYSSLPNDPFTPYLLGDHSIRVQSGTPEPYVNRTSIKQTEWSYGFMVHISQSLGVNCTYCHNSRSFSPWEASSPARTTAWHGIRMARELNANYLEPLEGILPPERKGPMGDALKVNCGTCHAGAYKPAYGSQLARQFPSLWRAAAPAAAAPAEPAPTPAASEQGGVEAEPAPLPGQPSGR